MAVEFTIEFPLRVIIYPATDLPGQWIAHGLETDLVTQGDTVEHALEMMGDAVTTLAAYNLKAYPGILPINLRPAPKEVWDLIGQAVPFGLRVKATVRLRGKQQASAPTGWPIYPFVSDHAPTLADAG